MLEILKDYGKTSINPKEVARVFGMLVMQYFCSSHTSVKKMSVLHMSELT